MVTHSHDTHKVGSPHSICHYATWNSVPSNVILLVLTNPHLVRTVCILISKDSLVIPPRIHDHNKQINHRILFYLEVLLPLLYWRSGDRHFHSKYWFLFLKATVRKQNNSKWITIISANIEYIHLMICTNPFCLLKGMSALIVTNESLYILRFLFAK